MVYQLPQKNVQCRIIVDYRNTMLITICNIFEFLERFCIEITAVWNSQQASEFTDKFLKKTEYLMYYFFNLYSFNAKYTHAHGRRMGEGVFRLGAKNFLTK